ncbi:MAG: DEAD/DEAH box helicase [Oscillospiraceae bacterium]|jgi:ATP-dependent Lhr-like helicase|nr:DEAD/DEAH box helicase [Oscillospiraceae bacterium]
MSLDLFSENTQHWFRSTLGEPTPVQTEAWKAIAGGKSALVSAPTGTGKTLSAFLVFIDRLMELSSKGGLKDELYLIYISPLKALAGDIRENLYRPLAGIADGGLPPVNVFVRTGDTTSSERRIMLRKPPHILITTPESLYLLLTSRSGREVLKSAEAVISDELHAMMNTKRGAHFMLSLARLDKLCGKPLQRIGLSATVNPLELAADYLSGGGSVEIIAPEMKKDFDIVVTGPKEDFGLLPHGTIWTEIARMVYLQCENMRSVIAFTDGRMFAEKLAFYVNQIAGEGFALTHHGCVSKEQRKKAELKLRSGDLRLLCATSSMELGIDVGEIDKVLQIGAPKSISSVLQRLGRAGHNPGRISIMHMFPKTAADGLQCGLTAYAAMNHGPEPLKPPRLCFDVLAQHLVSMATDNGYTIDDIMELLPRAYPFRTVTREDVKSILEMLAGDYEHERDLPVRPRVLYDRINERVEGDAYSRMLALSAGGTIPDTGMFTVKSESGVKLGELDEEFVFESRVSEKFLLGSFAWKIVQMDKDTVTVRQSNTDGARPPFYRNTWMSRNYNTSGFFGAQMRELSEAETTDDIIKILRSFGMDENSAADTGRYLSRQKEATGILPDDRTIIAEHFCDESGDNQLMVHSIFGKQINLPLGYLLQQKARELTNADIGCFDDDDGILLFMRGRREIPEKLLQTLDPQQARKTLEALLPASSIFNIAFRHNAARALIMGVRKGKRQPLWVQRLRGAETLDMIIKYKKHPLIRETIRECLEDFWNLDGLIDVLYKIRRGEIEVREFTSNEPSPMSLPLRRQAEANLLYEYFPSTKLINQSVAEALRETEKIKPAAEFLANSVRSELPENENQLHSLLMMQGDLESGEIDLPLDWFESLTKSGRIAYIEPGLWIAAEHSEEYSEALENNGRNALAKIIRRCLRYRGAMDAGGISARYFISAETTEEILRGLCTEKAVTEDNELFYHADLYEKARRETIAFRRREIKTSPPQNYAALLALNLRINAPPVEQLDNAVSSLADRAFPIGLWESVLLPARVKSYNTGLLDKLLSEGKYFWRINNSELSFHLYEDIDFDCEMSAEPDGDEGIIYENIKKRGAVFLSGLSGAVGQRPLLEPALNLIEKGLLRADSFVPVRQLTDREKLLTAPVKQRISATVKVLNAGRFDLAHPVMELTVEDRIERAFGKVIILCRETAAQVGLPWGLALEKLRVWEYAGKVRRGYFVEGLSGAQFIRDDNFTMAIHALANPRNDIVCLNAADPLMPWGKCIAHFSERSFICVSGTVVALKAGVPAALLEQQGKVLRIFNNDECIKDAVAALAADFKKGFIFPNLKRLIIKQYPKEAEDALTSAGFSRQMLDFALYK